MASSLAATQRELVFFSPRAFFAESKRNNVAASGICVTTLDAPVYGVTFASDESAPIWREGAAKASALALRFLEQVAAGDIPTPLFPPLAVSLATTFTYHSPQKILASSATVLDALRLTKAVAQAAITSPMCSCPTCAAHVPLFGSPSALVAQLTEDWLGKAVSIDVVGESTRLQEWSALRGFAYSDVSEQQGRAHLDTLTVSRERLSAVADLLFQAISARNSALLVQTTETRAMYALQGACSSCNLILYSTTEAELTRALAAGDAVPADLRGRQLGASTLQLFIDSPLSKLTELDPEEQIVPRVLRALLDTLELGALSCATRLAELSASTLTKLAIVDTLLQPETEESARIVDVPHGLFSQEELKTSLRHALPKSALVVLGATLDARASLPSLLPCTEIDEILSFTNQTPRRPHIRGVVRIQVPPHLRHLNIARRIYENLSELRRVSTDAPHQPQTVLPTTTLVPLFPRLHTPKALVATMLGLMEPLAALFSRSQQALMLGLSSKQFLISSTLRGTGDVCSKCYGAGLVIREVAGFTLPDSAPCPLCAGTRFRAPIADITFKGRTLWQLLNGTIHEALPALRALPKKGSTLKIIEALSLADLPLGLPARLLSPDEHRLLLIVQGILRGTRSHPSLLVVEAASAGFSSQKQRALERLLTCDAPTLLPHTTVVLVEE